jgi:cytochrome b6-f complex iron-sulfur subunit
MGLRQVSGGLALPLLVGGVDPARLGDYNLTPRVGPSGADSGLRGLRPIMSEPTTPPAAPPAAPATPPKPAPPAKPAAPAKKGTDRRFFLLAMVGSWFAAGMTALTLSLVGMVLGTVRFLFPNVLSEPPSQFKVGTPDTYEEGKVVDRYKDQGFWVVKNNGILYALSTTCTHLGCTPNWLEGDRKFKCPCHGSGFYITGVNFEGPAPRPLERFSVRLADDGQVLVDKGRKFQKELGDWGNPDSFLKV